MKSIPIGNIRTNALRDDSTIHQDFDVHIAVGMKNGRSLRRMSLACDCHRVNASLDKGIPQIEDMLNIHRKYQGRIKVYQVQ
jgi:hypothetical protein